MALAHAHSFTVMWDALLSLSPLCWGVELGWRACAGSRQYTYLPNSSVIALRLQQHGRRAATLQVWNGMMVLLGAARSNRTQRS
jgi:hypothetical protein